MNRWFRIGDNDKELFLLLKRITAKFPFANRILQIIVITNSVILFSILCLYFSIFQEVLSLIHYRNNVVIFAFLYDSEQPLVITIYW